MQEWVVDHAHNDQSWRRGFTDPEIDEIQKQIAPHIDSPAIPTEAYASPEALHKWLSNVPADKFPVRIGVDARHLDGSFTKPKILYHAMNVDGMLDASRIGGEPMAVVKNPQTGGVKQMSIPDLWKMFYERPDYENNPQLPKQTGPDAASSATDRPARGETPPEQAIMEHGLQQVQRAELLANGPLKLSEESTVGSLNDPGLVTSGTIEGSSGETVRVVARKGHRESEVQARKFHELTEFTSTIPATAHRDAIAFHGGTVPGDVQEYVGSSLVNRPKLTQRIDVFNKDFVEQMHEAIAERLIIGDGDTNPTNLPATRRNGTFTIANIDLTPAEGAFSTSIVPHSTSLFGSKPLAPAVLDKINRLIEKLDSPAGKESLREIGLSDEQSHALIMRARVLATYGRLPDDKEWVRRTAYRTLLLKLES